MTVTTNPDAGSEAQADFIIDIIGKIIKFSHVITDITITKSGGDPTLTYAIANGTAFIEGVFITISSEASKTVGASATTKVYLQLSINGNGSPDSGVIASTTGALPARSIQLAEIVTDATTITSVTDKRDLISDLSIPHISTNTDFNATKFSGMIRYDSIKKEWLYWNGTKWRLLGGGGMMTKYIFAAQTEIDPADNTGYASPFSLITLQYGFSGGNPTDSDVGNTAWQYQILQNDGTTAQNLTSSEEYQGVDPITFGGLAIGRIGIACTLVAVSIYSSSTSINLKINATTTKIEILDGATVKATILLPNDRTTGTTSSTARALSTNFFGHVDLGGFVFTDFRIKVTIHSTTNTTTNQTQHRHMFFGVVNSETDTTVDVRAGQLEVEIIG